MRKIHVMTSFRTLARTIPGLGLAVLLAVLLAGCGGGSAALVATPTVLPSTWSRPLALAETTAASAPAFVMTSSGWVLAWAEDSTLQLAIVHADGSLDPAQTVVMGRAPWNPTLLPTPGGAWHLLWQDTDRLGEVRLYSALLQPDGALSRGPLLVAPDPVSAYTVAVAANGTVAVVWADVNPRPQLFGRAIDATGRPAAVPQPIAFGTHAARPLRAGERRLGSGLAPAPGLAPRARYPLRRHAPRQRQRPALGHIRRRPRRSAMWC